MTPTEQLGLWLEGKSVHNDERNECCPDFSCCKPELLADLEVRQLFHTAYATGAQHIYNALLMGFLSGGVSAAEREGLETKVYLAGLQDGAVA